MSTMPHRSLALALAVAGTLACGALSGTAMAAGDDEPASLTPRKAGGSTQELTMRKSGGDPETASIIAVL